MLQQETTSGVDATVERLKKDFIPQMLSEPYNVAHWPGTLVSPYQNKVKKELFTYLEQKYAIKENYYHLFEFGHESKKAERGVDMFWTDKFLVDGSIVLDERLLPRETEAICRRVDDGIKLLTEQYQNLKDIVKHTKITRSELTEVPHAAEINMKAEINPVPDNFRKYLPVIDLYAYAKTWLKSISDAFGFRFESEIDAIVHPAAPNAREIFQ